MIDTKEVEALSAHIRSAGEVVECALTRLGNENIAGFKAAMNALNSGAMLMVKTTAGTLGLIVIAIDLVLPNGEAFTMMSVEMEHPTAPSIN